MALNGAVAGRVRTALASYAASDPWRRTWLTSAAARTAWANGILAEIEAFRLNRNDPYFRKRIAETRDLIAPFLTASDLQAVDTYLA
jgi:hypothetical protein